MYTVYVHTTPSGKRYVGMTKRDPKERWNYGYGYKSQKVFWRAIVKYGWDNITHEIIATNLTHKEACELEQQLVARYNTTNSKFGYNQTVGGDGTVGFSHKNPHSDEWRKKVSIANTGKKRSEESKARISVACKGKTISEETKQKISTTLKHKGHKPSVKCLKKSINSHRCPIYVYDNHDRFIGLFVSLSSAAKYLEVSTSYLSCILAGKYKNPEFHIERKE